MHLSAQQVFVARFCSSSPRNGSHFVFVFCRVDGYRSALYVKKKAKQETRARFEFRFFASTLSLPPVRKGTQVSIALIINSHNF